MEETFCDDILFKTSHSYINEESGAYFEINSTEKPAEAKIDADIKMEKVLNEDVEQQKEGESELQATFDE